MATRPSPIVLAPVHRKLLEKVPDMDPGTVFFFNALEAPNFTKRFPAALACIRCKALNVMTHKQVFNGEPIICSALDCSAEFFIYGDTYFVRPPQ